MTKHKILNFLSSNIAPIITISLFFILFIAGGLRYNNFLSMRIFLNFFNDNAYLIVVAVGVTFVLLTGGIDISVSSQLAFTCVLSAFLLKNGWSPIVVIPLVLVIGFASGSLIGYIIQRFKIQPFIVTLAGLFFFRGLCSIVTTQSIAIENSFYKLMALNALAVGKARIYYYVFIAILVVIIAFYVLNHTKFGRSVYAVGGNAQSAFLMGLPVSRVKILVYSISGFCASLGGVIFSFYTLAGYPLQNMGLELDAISSSVIGGTLLTGGVGGVIGAMFGVLIQGVIQTIIIFENLNTWWTKVSIASILCIFIIAQRLIAIRAEKSKGELA